MLKNMKTLEYNISIIKIVIKHIIILYEFNIMNVNIFYYIFSQTFKKG
jgi:hypothetical protein